MLSFRTTVHELRIGEVIHDQSVPDDAIQEYYMMDGERYRIGKVWTRDRVARKQGKHQFIALSSRKTGIAIKDAVADKYIPTSSDGKGNSSKNPASSWKVINVMLVVWKGDVAFRVAVGQVISKAWDEKATKLIYLG
jgi:hypothetical protein